MLLTFSVRMGTGESIIEGLLVVHLTSVQVKIKKTSHLVRFAESAAARAAKKKEGAAARQDKTRFLTNFVEEETFLMDKSFVFKPNKSVEQRWIQLLLPPQDPGAIFYRIFVKAAATGASK